jgi:hypothetical protein
MAKKAMDIAELAEVLWRVARIIRALPGEETGQDCLVRPFPSGGAIHELEFYVAVDACAGLSAGFQINAAMKKVEMRMSIPPSPSEVHPIAGYSVRAGLQPALNCSPCYPADCGGNTTKSAPAQAERLCECALFQAVRGIALTAGRTWRRLTSGAMP